MSEEPPEILEVTCRVNVADYITFNAHHRGLGGRVLRRWAIAGGCVVIPAGLLFGLLLLSGGRAQLALGLVVAVVACVLLLAPVLVFLARWEVAMQARRLLRRNPHYIGEARVALTPEGVGYDEIAGYGLRRWPWIHKVVATEDHLFLYTGSTNALIVPRHDFPSDEEFAEFARTARMRWEQAKAQGTMIVRMRPTVPKDAGTPLTRPGPDEGVFRP